MTTRANQFEILATGILYSGAAIVDGYAKFFAAGTTTAKNAYADKDKSSSFTKLELDSDGRGTAFGDGVYKICFYEDGDPDVTAADPIITIDNYKCRATYGDIPIVTANTTVDPDDEILLIDSSSTAITIAFETVTGFVEPVRTMIIDNTNTVTFNPYSSETANGQLTLTNTEPYRMMTWMPDATNSRWYVDEGVDPPGSVTITTSGSISRVLHHGKVLVLNQTGDSVTCTLPAASGSGAVYDFYVGAVNTNGYVISVNSTSATMSGSATMCQDGGDTIVAFETTAASDTIALNGTTTGGASVGDNVRLVDIATNKWAVAARLCGSGTEATPFSAAV